jgi:murein DD-endopeptidase MepM/ murein hydrolase activator NlpD
VKKIKILFLPAGSGQAKQLIIPHLLMILGSILLCASVGLIPWLVQDYMSLSIQKHQLSRLQKETRKKQSEVSNLCLRVEKVSGQLQGLLELDRKLRIAANLEEQRAEKNILAMGGSVPNSSPSTRYLEDEGELDSETIFRQQAPDKRMDVIRAQQDDASRISMGYSFTPLMIPGQHPVKGFIRSSFGSKVSPEGDVMEFNEGIDISTRLKATVAAPFDGFVVSYRRDAAQGWILSLTHGHGLVTSYAQLDQILVQEGQYVKRGERIGMVGRGDQKGPHLHFEIRLNDLAVNPLLYISKASFCDLACVVS